jgi:hypothetical protein
LLSDHTNLVGMDLVVKAKSIIPQVRGRIPQAINEVLEARRE